MIAGITTISPRTSAALTASTVVVSAGADLWKYIAHQPQSRDGAWVTPEFPDGNVTIGPACQPCLFNLRADPEERHDLSQVEPELVARLAAELGNQTHFQTGKFPFYTRFKPSMEASWGGELSLKHIC